MTRKKRTHKSLNKILNYSSFLFQVAVVDFVHEILEQSFSHHVLVNQSLFKWILTANTFQMVWGPWQTSWKKPLPPNTQDNATRCHDIKVTGRPVWFRVAEITIVLNNKWHRFIKGLESNMFKLCFQYSIAANESLANRY